MMISRMRQFLMIIRLTQQAFVVKISCIDEKFITTRHPRLTQKKKIMRNCQYQESYITKNKQKKEK